MKSVLILKQLEQSYRVSNFEYLVFKANGETVSTDFGPDEAERIYEVITTLPFPLNTNPLLASKIKILMDGVPYNLHTEEKIAVEYALKKISQDLVVLPVPKSLMQFDHAMTIYSSCRKILHREKLHQDMYSAIISLLSEGVDLNEIIEQDFGDTHYFLQKFYAGEGTDAKNYMRKNAQFSKLWLCLNMYLVKKIIDSYNIDLKNTYRNLAKEFVGKYKSDKSISFYGVKKENSSQILDLLYLEIDIMFDPKFLNYIALYRGTKNGYHGDIETLSLPDNLDGSLSFGNGLFAGILKDHGACALNHILNGSSGQHLKNANLARGYVVFVNIPKFLANGIDRALYWIPPTFFSVLGHGETFHARTLGKSGRGNSGKGLFDAVEEINGQKYLKNGALLSYHMFERMMDHYNARAWLIPHLSINSMNLTLTADSKHYSKDIFSLPSLTETLDFVNKRNNRVVISLLKDETKEQLVSRSALNWLFNKNYRLNDNTPMDQNILPQNQQPLIEQIPPTHYSGFKPGFLLNRKNGLFH